VRAGDDRGIARFEVLKDLLRGLDKRTGFRVEDGLAVRADQGDRDLVRAETAAGG